MKVGEIEREVNWPMRLRAKYGPLDAKDYYSRKLRLEIDEHNALLISVSQDAATNETIRQEMIAFVSAIFGNDGWFRVVEARYLRIKQSRREKEYDPDASA